MPDGLLPFPSHDALPDIGGAEVAGSATRRGRSGGLGITSRLAWRNLVHDRARFVVTLVGIVFSVVLMAVQTGMLLGFAETAAAVVTHAGADFWAMSRGTANVDQSVTMPARWRFELLEVPGVAVVDKLIMRFTDWRRPDGRSEVINVVGFDLDGGMGAPWSAEPGATAALHRSDAVIIDRVYAAKLGITPPEETAQIRGRRARIIGFTNGIRAFSQSPYIFTSYDNAETYTDIPPDQTNYLLVRVRPGTDRRAIAAKLREALPMADIHSSAEFAWMTAYYWLFTTGAGIALVAGAVLGSIIGVIIVAQTLYAATIERLAEFATLKAMGATGGYLSAIVLKQALIGGVLGSVIGLAVARLLVAAARNTTISLILPWPLAATIALLTLLMCAAASLVAIHKLRRVDPTMVFR
jgi:putative ABC transport system permease protein